MEREGEEDMKKVASQKIGGGGVKIKGQITRELAKRQNDDREVLH